MSFAHRMMDFGLWCVAIGWLCGFLARHPGPTLRQRRKPLPPPSTHCERTGQFEVRMCGFSRRQAD